MRPPASHPTCPRRPLRAVWLAGLIQTLAATAGDGPGPGTGLATAMTPAGPTAPAAHDAGMDRTTGPATDAPPPGDATPTPEPEPQLSRGAGFDRAFDNESIETPFDTELTGTSAAGEHSLSARPRTRDLVDNPYLRFPVRIRYGVTDHLELFGTLEGYVDNPARSPSQWGLSRFEPGFKWQWPHPPGSPWRLALGSSWELPLARPPEDIQDGFARLRPFAVATRPHNLSPYVLPYLNVSADLVHEPPGRTPPGGDKPRHRLAVQPGLLWKPPGPWRGVMEVGWRTDSIDGGNEHKVSLRPGLARELPGSWLGAFGLRGRAELGLSLNIPVSGGGGLGSSVSARYQFGSRR